MQCHFKHTSGVHVDRVKVKVKVKVKVTVKVRGEGKNEDEFTAARITMENMIGSR